MTMRPAHRLCVLILALTVACAACALHATTPVTPAPGDGKPQGAIGERPKGPEYAAPQLAIGQEGRLYLIWLALERGRSWDVLFARSEDFGATWSPPRSLKPDKAVVAGGIRIAAGPSNTVYVAWRESDVKTKLHTLRFMRSADGGGQWGDSTGLLDPPSDLGIPDLLVNRGGDVSLAWLTGAGGQPNLQVVSSYDAGTTFLPKPIGLTPALPASPYGIMNHRLTSDGEGRLYLVWQEIRDWDDKGIYLSWSVDRGQTWAARPILVSASGESKSLAYSPQISAWPDGRVYIVWEQDEFRAGYVPGEIKKPDRLIYINRSLDYGQTWLAQPIRLNEAGQGRINSLSPRLSADRRGHIYVTWIEEEGPTRGRLIVARSADSGLTWSAPRVRLDLSSPFKGRLAHPEIRSDDFGQVWVIWQELNPGPKGWQLLMNRSEDHGKSWRNHATTLTGPAQRGEGFRVVSFLDDAHGRLYVAWDGGPKNSQEISVSRSTDFGATWLSRDVYVAGR